MIGKIAFEAYCKRLNNKDVRGNEIPQWDDLSHDVKDGWTCAALVVKNLTTSPYMPCQTVESMNESKGDVTLM